jgi:hypothetical protein
MEAYMSCIRKGTFGVVLMTKDEATKRMWLMDRDTFGPFITANNMVEAACVKRLMNVTAGGRLPNVVPYLGISTIKDSRANNVSVAVRMARAQGTLLDYMQRTSKDQRAASLRDVATGLIVGVMTLHEHGMIHGDIKPANVLVSAWDAETGAVRAEDVFVADLGSVSMATHCGDTSRVRKCCTMDYCAPEVFKDTSARCSAATDAFSVGTLLWQFVHGATIVPLSTSYSSDKKAWSGFKHAYGDPSYLERVNAVPDNISEGLWRVVQGLMQPSSSQRMALGEALGALGHESAMWPLPGSWSNDAAGMPWSTRRARKAAVTDTFEMAKEIASVRCAPLACNYLDRLAACEERDPCRQEIRACVKIACSLVCQDIGCIEVDSDDIEDIARILDILKMDLYVDTCDVLLVASGACTHETLDYGRLKHAIMRSNCSSDAAMRLYVTSSQRAKQGPGLPAGRLGCRGAAGAGERPLVPDKVLGQGGDVHAEAHQLGPAQGTRKRRAQRAVAAQAPN